MRLMDTRHGFDLRNLLSARHTPFVVREHPPQTTIFMQGEPSTGVMYVESGTVRLSVSTPSGKEAICGVLTTGAFLGESVLRGDPTHPQTATTMTASVVIEITLEDMQRLLRSESMLLERFIGHVLSRHAHLEADLIDQIINASEQRLARALLRLAGCNGHGADRRALPRISQEHLAEMVGTTRSRVNAFMGKFKKLGLLQADGDVLMVHPSLRDIARGTLVRNEDPIGG